MAETTGVSMSAEKKRGRPRTHPLLDDEDESHDAAAGSKTKNESKRKRSDSEENNESGNVAHKRKYTKHVPKMTLPTGGLVPVGIKRKRGRPAKNDIATKSMMIQGHQPNMIKRDASNKSNFAGRIDDDDENDAESSYMLSGDQS